MDLEKTSICDIYKMTFKDISIDDTNTFINIDDIGVMVNINGFKMPIVYSSTEDFELQQVALELPQAQKLIIYCKKQDLNKRGLSKLVLNGTPYNILSIAEVGQLLKLILEVIL